MSGPTIVSLRVQRAAPGTIVVVSGTKFGGSQGTGYLRLEDNGNTWGTPGSPGALPLLHWSDTQIQFTVPTTSPDGLQITPGTEAAVTVVDNTGLASGPLSFLVISAVTWPLTVQSSVRDIGTSGNGHMQTDVHLDQAGNLTGSTHTWDTSGWGPFTGFHGGTYVRFYDIARAELTTQAFGPYGVEGGQDRHDPLSALIPQHVLDQVCYLSVGNFYDPQYSAPGSVWNWTKDNAPAIAAAAKVIVAVF